MNLVKAITGIGVSIAMTVSLGGLPATAVVNGVSAEGENYVVALVDPQSPTESRCSGAYFAPRIVITAAHCVIVNGGRAQDFAYQPGRLHVSQPGANLTTETSRASLVKVLQVWTEPTYFSRWEPDKGLMETQVDDIAFLFLEKELNGPHVDRAATKEEVALYRSGQFIGYQMGYGCLGKLGDQFLPNGGIPYRANGAIGSQRTMSHIPDKERHLVVDFPPGVSICPGDSGSPLLAEIGGEVVYIATVFAGNAWDRILNGDPSMRGEAVTTVLWPYLPTLALEQEKFQRTLEELARKAQEAEALEARRAFFQRLAKERARRAGTLYVSGGCHAIGINAELQILRRGKWQTLAKAKVWEKVAACPSTHPVAPWTTARPAPGSKLRWRYWSVNEWSVTSDVFTARRR